MQPKEPRGFNMPRGGFYDRESMGEGFESGANLPASCFAIAK